MFEFPKCNSWLFLYIENAHTPQASAYGSQPCKCVMEYQVTKNSKFFIQVVVSGQKNHESYFINYEINTRITHDQITNNLTFQGVASEGLYLVKNYTFSTYSEKSESNSYQIVMDPPKKFKGLMKILAPNKLFAKFDSYHLNGSGSEVLAVYNHVDHDKQWFIEIYSNDEWSKNAFPQQIQYFIEVKKIIGFPLKYAIIVGVCVPILGVTLIISVIVGLQRLKQKRIQKAYIQKIHKAGQNTDQTHSSHSQAQNDVIVSLNDIPESANNFCERTQKNACSVCLNQNCNTISLCGHQFHKQCIRQWLKCCHRCPNCRTWLKNQQIQFTDSL